MPGSFLGGSWEGPGKVLGVSWDDPGRILGGSWEDPGSGPEIGLKSVFRLMPRTFCIFFFVCFYLK